MPNVPKQVLDELLALPNLTPAQRETLKKASRRPGRPRVSRFAFRMLRVWWTAYLAAHPGAKPSTLLRGFLRDHRTRLKAFGIKTGTFGTLMVRVSQGKQIAAAARARRAEWNIVPNIAGSRIVRSHAEQGYVLWNAERILNGDFENPLLDE